MTLTGSTDRTTASTRERRNDFTSTQRQQQHQERRIEGTIDATDDGTNDGICRQKL